MIAVHVRGSAVGVGHVMQCHGHKTPMKRMRCDKLSKHATSILSGHLLHEYKSCLAPWHVGILSTS